MRIYNRVSRFCTMVAMYLLATLVLFSSSARAQRGHAAGDNHTSKSDMKFEIVSIKPSQPGTYWAQGPGLIPNGYRNRGLNMWQIIMLAYNPQSPMLVWETAKLQNAPDWVVKDMYDIDARVASENVTAWLTQDPFNPVLLRSALQQALKDRCHLSLHAVRSEIPYLNLVVGKHGLKIKEMAAGQSVPARAMTLQDGGRMALEMRDGKVNRHFYGATMKEFALTLTEFSPEHPVQDKTGITGRYEFVLKWRQDEGQEANSGEEIYNWPVDDFGLALKPGKGPAISFVVDHIEKPSAN